MFGLEMRAKLLIIFLFATVVPLFILTIVTWRQFVTLSGHLAGIATKGASTAMHDMATENIERMTTDTALAVADFLYARDRDILYLASINPSEELYRSFAESKLGRVSNRGAWELSPDGKMWKSAIPQAPESPGGKSSNTENNDMDGFRYRKPDAFRFNSVPYYDEITFIDLKGNELVKVTASSSPKINYPLSPKKKNVSRRENTYVKAETYFAELSALKSGEIFVSDVIGAYVGSNYIGMYVPDAVAAAANTRGYDIKYDPEAQAYAGK